MQKGWHAAALRSTELTFPAIYVVFLNREVGCVSLVYGAYSYLVIVTPTSNEGKHGAEFSRCVAFLSNSRSGLP